MFCENALGYLRYMVNARVFKPLPLCVSTSEHLTSRHFWSSRNESNVSHFLCRNMCSEKMLRDISDTWWMLELSNICHCIQHFWKLTNRYFWSCKKESKPLSMQNMVFWDNAVGYLRYMVNARAFKPLPLCSALSENLLVGMTGTLGSKRKATLLSKNVFWENAVGYLWNSEC